MIYKPKNKYLISEVARKRIEVEIESLSTNLPEGIYHKEKELDTGYYLNVMIDKKKFKICNEEKNIPEYITFLVILDSNFPFSPPKILSKTNFCFPSFMDGRDLFAEIFKNEWNEKCKLVELLLLLPNFIQRVINSKINYFYGKFELGAVCDIKNFGNMLVNNFTCKLDLESRFKKIIENELNCTLILSDDAFVLFEMIDSIYGKIIFWSSLYAIVDIQLNKVQKTACINFYSDENEEEFFLKIRLDNILFFREALVKRMNQIKIKVEHTKLLKGQQTEKKLTDKEISAMSIDDLNIHIDNFRKRIEQNMLTYYNVKTLISLCQKAVENYAAVNDSRYEDYLDIVKNMLSREEVSILLNDKDS